MFPECSVYRLGVQASCAFVHTQLDFVTSSLCYVSSCFGRPFPAAAPGGEQRDYHGGLYQYPSVRVSLYHLSEVGHLPTKITTDN
jgi:hypothetical protein